MRLKIVGGPHDGQEREVGCDEDYVELVKIQPEPMTYGDLSLTAGMVVTTVKTGYTVRLLRYCHPNRIEEFRFLAPVWMTDIEAIRYQFSK